MERRLINTVIHKINGQGYAVSINQWIEICDEYDSFPDDYRKIISFDDFFLASDVFACCEVLK